MIHFRGPVVIASLSHGLPLLCCFSFLCSPWLFICFCLLLLFSLGDLSPIVSFSFLSHILLFPFYCVHLFLTDHNLELKRYSVVVSSSDSGVRQKSSSAVWLWAFYLTSLSLIFLICKMRPIIYFTIAIRTKKENTTVSTAPENKCSIGTNFLIWVWLYSVSFWGDNESEL